MSDTPHSQHPGMARAMAHAALGLGLFALVTAGVVAGTRALTFDRIAENRLASQYRLLGEVLPARLDDMPVADLLEAGVTLPAAPRLGQDAPFVAWRARRAGTAAVILPVIAEGGYSGDIDLLVGITAQGRISGVRVTRHQETPGLGDAIERRKSDWIAGFEGRSLANTAPEAWAVAKDGGAFDAFTGATITPRAVIETVRRSLEYAATQRDRLFGEPPEETP